jgi:hypothetical protein
MSVAMCALRLLTQTPGVPVFFALQPCVGPHQREIVDDDATRYEWPSMMPASMSWASTRSRVLIHAGLLTRRPLTRIPEVPADSDIELAHLHFTPVAEDARCSMKC